MLGSSELTQGEFLVVRVFASAFLIAIGAATAFAAQPSAVLPRPTLRPSLPISVASTTPASADEAAEACDMKRVMRVDSGNASPIAQGFAFDAYGQADSAGWQRAQLVLAYQDHGVATVDFVACRPEDTAHVVTPVETHIGLGLDPRTTRVIIRSRTNTVSVDIH
jgi:hypothetical protein